jgi:predicted TIM-barrel fold metal-dependent hydrolase
MASRAQNRKKAEKVAQHAMMGDTRPLEQLAEQAEKLGVPFVTKDGKEFRSKEEIVANILNMLGC